MSKKNKSDKNKISSQEDQLSLYYKSILKKAEDLVKENKLNQALEIINDELESPYIPKEYLTEFTNFSYYLSAEINYLSKLKNFESLNREQLFDEIFTDKICLNTTALSLFLDRYKDDLELDEIKIMEGFLASKKTDYISKQFLFTSLKNINFDKDVDYFNPLTNQLFSVNAKTTATFPDSKYFKDLRILIEELTYKEPSLEQFCSSILFNIYLYNFPNVPKFDCNELAFSIFQYMIYSLQGGEKKYKYEKIIKHIEQVIEASSGLSKNKKN